MADYKPVVFENSLGEEISNDPNYLAMKQLQQAGISFAGSQPTDLQAGLAAAQGEQESPNASSLSDDPDSEVEDSEDDEPRDYTDLKGKALGAYAKERGLSLKDDDGNAKTVGAIREELIELDKAQAAEAEGE